MIKYKILNAAEYGVPQIRMRVVFIGIRDDICFDEQCLFPKGKYFDKKQITIRQAIMDLPQLEAGQGIEEQEYSCKPQNDY